MKSDIVENMVVKGSLNDKPIGMRPSPPKGQGNKSTDIKQLQSKIRKVAHIIKMTESGAVTVDYAKLKQHLLELADIK